MKRKPQWRGGHDQNDELARRLLFKQSIVTIMLMAITFVSGIYTHEGLGNQLEAVGGATWQTKVLSLAFAICVSVILFLLWWIAFGLVPQFKTRMRKGAGMVLVIFALPWVIATSSLFNAQGLFGPLAQRQRLVDGVDLYEVALDTAYRQVLMVQAFVPWAEGEAAYYCQLADGEASGGLVSARGGPGPVTAAVTRGCAQMCNLAGALAASVADSGPRIEAARARIEAMRTEIYDTTRPLLHRERVYVFEAIALDSLISELRGSGLLETVGMIADGLEYGVIGGETADGAYGDQQSELIANIRRAYGQTGEGIAQRVEALRALDIPEAPKVRPISPTIAVMTYWRDYWGNWAAAIGVDTAPMWFLLFFLLAGDVRTREQHVKHLAFPEILGAVLKVKTMARNQSAANQGGDAFDPAA